MTIEPNPLREMLSDELFLAISEVIAEVKEAMGNYPPMTSYHDGWAIIREELEELWDEIKLKPSRRDAEKIRREAVQVAAMAVRFLVDLRKK